MFMKRVGVISTFGIFGEVLIATIMQELFLNSVIEDLDQDLSRFRSPFRFQFLFRGVDMIATVGMITMTGMIIMTGMIGMTGMTAIGINC